MDSDKNSAREWQNAAAIITGAGSGLGAATANIFAAAGARLLLVGRDENKLRHTAKESGAHEVVCLAGDLGDSSFCGKVLEKAVAQFGRADVLVNNAGAIYRGAATQTSDAAWEKIMRINLDAVFWLSRGAMAQMLQQKSGAIVNISSTVGLVGAENLAAYCAGKGGVVQLTRALALEGAAHGITVNAVCPGAIETPMLFSEHAKGVSEKEVRAKNIAAIPQRRLASAEEVARAVFFLASEPHITGALLPIDGGYTAQ